MKRLLVASLVGLVLGLLASSVILYQRYVPFYKQYVMVEPGVTLGTVLDVVPQLKATANALSKVIEKTFTQKDVSIQVRERSTLISAAITTNTKLVIVVSSEIVVNAKNTTTQEEGSGVCNMTIAQNYQKGAAGQWEHKEQEDQYLELGDNCIAMLLFLGTLESGEAVAE